jgi:hypothetical protein
MDMSSRRNDDIANAHAGEPVSHNDEVDIQAILMFGAGLLALGISVYLLMWGLFYFLQGRESALQPPPASRAGGVRDQFPPEPRLQGLPGHSIHPMEELKQAKEQEDQLLSTYGWVDQKAGIVRIPIEEAMKRLLEKGLPVRPEQKEPEGR